MHAPPLRRGGHNEQDDPSLTLPLTYAAIREHPPVLQQYAEELVQDGLVTKEQLEAWHTELRDYYEQEYANAVQVS